MTPVKVSIIASIAAFLLILVVLELIRSRRLRERYALLWLRISSSTTSMSRNAAIDAMIETLSGVTFPPGERRNDETFR